VDEVAGVVWRAVPGDRVTAGQVLFELHTSEQARLPGALEALAGAASIGDGPARRGPLVLDRIG
jgi:thymidine phosphorylase